MSLPNKEKHRFYNPIRQNKGHIKWLVKCVGEVPTFSVITFSERCELKSISVSSKNVWVIQRPQTNSVVRTIWKENEDFLTEEQVDAIYRKLKDFTNVSKEVKEEHIRYTRNVKNENLR